MGKTKRNITTLKALSDKGVFVTANNNEAVKKSELILLAVKPFQVAEVIAGLKKDLGTKLLKLRGNQPGVRFFNLVTIQIYQSTGFDRFMMRRQMNY